MGGALCLLRQLPEEEGLDDGARLFDDREGLQVGLWDRGVADWLTGVGNEAASVLHTQIVALVGVESACYRIPRKRSGPDIFPVDVQVRLVVAGVNLRNDEGQTSRHHKARGTEARRGGFEEVVAGIGVTGTLAGREGAAHAEVASKDRHARHIPNRGAVGGVDSSNLGPVVRECPCKPPIGVHPPPILTPFGDCTLDVDSDLLVASCPSL
mmetsp:Transcript_42623/g.102836  ORF Transcript_42623/g.102836 Transcript_42623/m.102836 type:complete len:211 (-) Transcript_42623:423-1055(-)